MAGKWVLAITVAGAILSASCRATIPSAPTAGAPFQGTWSGVVVDDLQGSGTAVFMIVQAGAGLSGSFTATFASGGDVGGTVSGTAYGSTATVVVTPRAPLVCPGGVVLRGTLAFTLLVSDSRVSGSYSGLTCGGARAGRVDLTRQ